MQDSTKSELELGCGKQKSTKLRANEKEAAEGKKAREAGFATRGCANVLRDQLTGVMCR